MVNTELLRKAITNSGMPITEVCRRSNIKRANLYSKMKKPNTFNVTDIDGLVIALHLSKADRDSIFFAKEVD